MKNGKQAAKQIAFINVSMAKRAVYSGNDLGEFSWT